MAEKLTDQIERAAVYAKTSDERGGERYLTFSETVQASQAISLKRIADLMESTLGDEALNEYGETPFKAISAGIARALRENYRP